MEIFLKYKAVHKFIHAVAPSPLQGEGWDGGRVHELVQRFIHVDCSLETCEARDVKGLYQKARAGEIEQFTGISSPYEPPEKPELSVKTDQETLEESVQKVLNLLKARGIINLKPES